MNTGTLRCPICHGKQTRIDAIEMSTTDIEVSVAMRCLADDCGSLWRSLFILAHTDTITPRGIYAEPRIFTTADDALDAWGEDERQVILHSPEGLYAVGFDPQIAHGREAWTQPSPEELTLALDLALATYYQGNGVDGTPVMLGATALADAQRQADEQAGGLAAIACNRRL